MARGGGAWFKGQDPLVGEGDGLGSSGGGGGTAGGSGLANPSLAIPIPSASYDCERMGAKGLADERELGRRRCWEGGGVEGQAPAETLCRCPRSTYNCVNVIGSLHSFKITNQ